MNSSSAASKMTKAHGRRPSKNRMRDHLSGWLFVLPLLVVFLVFIGIPVFRTVFYLGFTDYNLMKDPAWVGLSNYEKLLSRIPILSKSNIVPIGRVLREASFASLAFRAGSLKLIYYFAA